jgi:hypothetical protein
MTTAQIIDSETNYQFGSLPDARNGHHNTYGPVIGESCNVNSYYSPAKNLPHRNHDTLPHLSHLLLTPSLLQFRQEKLLQQSKLNPLLLLFPSLSSPFPLFDIKTSKSILKSTPPSLHVPAYTETGPSRAVLPFSDDRRHSHVPQRIPSKPLKYDREEETSRYQIIPV